MDRHLAGPALWSRRPPWRRRPENSLTGTIFQVDSYRSSTRSPSLRRRQSPFLAQHQRRKSTAGADRYAARNYLGYEWDELPDNGFRPAGLIELSSTTFPVHLSTRLRHTTGSATATHNLTLYRAPSGALVFGAGTVYWAWGLDANHDLEATPEDPRVKQAMVNLLADMGI